MPSVSDWNAFFADFAARYESAAVEQADAFPPERYAAFFSRFDVLRTAYLAQGRGVNVVELAGVGRDELRNCSLLAWLLDCSGSHGQGAAFLRRFLECVPESGRPEGFPLAADISARYRTTLESSYDEEAHNGKQRSRVDIELDGNGFLLFIEVKVQAGEGEKQLARYLSLARMRAGKRPWGLAFVTPTGREPVAGEARGKVACLSWRTVGRSFLRHARTLPETHGSIVIRQICEHFSDL